MAKELDGVEEERGRWSGGRGRRVGGGNVDIINLLIINFVFPE